MHHSSPTKWPRGQKNNWLPRYPRVAVPKNLFLLDVLTQRRRSFSNMHEPAWIKAFSHHHSKLF
jgi:hypothetical protein